MFLHVQGSTDGHALLTHILAPAENDKPAKNKSQITGEKEPCPGLRRWTGLWRRIRKQQKHWKKWAEETLNHGDVLEKTPWRQEKYPFRLFYQEADSEYALCFNSF